MYHVHTCKTILLTAFELQLYIMYIIPDLTTYDSVKQAILGHTNLGDNALVHSMSRYVSMYYVHSYVYVCNLNLVKFMSIHSLCLLECFGACVSEGIEATCTCTCIKVPGVY